MILKIAIDKYDEIKTGFVFGVDENVAKMAIFHLTHSLYVTRYPCSVSEFIVSVENCVIELIIYRVIYVFD